LSLKQCYSYIIDNQKYVLEVLNGNLKGNISVTKQVSCKGLLYPHLKLFVTCIYNLLQRCYI